eukprot:gnl/TRDRNA2_/TRDRNA2_161850_c0_seq2.p1 gnl/TRDRNA2_/TRDRNA2_161850_c0~~gnl/TRDRNA2_/TRDRNA2_161850_c0_seq2.p1  ORF type:complete len:325 (+),score=68.55 gnl/TRDRNA2_/TRDRNA2_161850_c0_seq2:112-1086(+)
MAKVAPVESGDHESPQGRTFEGPFKKPIPCNTPLETYDAAYLKRKKEVGEKFFTCKSGRKLCYFTDGATDPSKEGIAVVLCLHSCMLQKYMWLQQEPFKDIFQISVDRMGHGGSSDPPQPNGDAFDYTFADLVPELVELMDALYKEWSIPAEKKFFVVGHSMGAVVAYELARKAQKLKRPPPKATVLAAAWPPVGYDVYAAKFWSAGAIEDDDTLVARMIDIGGVDADAVKEPQLRALLVPIWRADLQVELGYHHEPEPLLAAQTRLCVVAAQEDVTIPVAQVRLWGGCAERTELLELPGGHFFHREAPSAEDFVGRVAKWLER